ncbi:MAG: extracellular solute-binding protein, partial [Anaerolineae bacterium]|nr:extracellular solute-binding protein [Anaerolineae bacterium]
MSAEQPAEQPPVTETPGDTPTANPLVLVIWIAEPLSLSGGEPGGAVLNEAFATFDEQDPDIRVEVYQKEISGPGGTLDYLQTASAAAPAVLPDIALLDREALSAAARGGLIVPLDDLITPSLRQSLYPAATALATVDGRLVAVPYLMEMEHLVYRTTVFRGKPPTSLETVLENTVPFHFPAAPADTVSTTVLTQYLADGGRLVGEDGLPVLDTAPLSQVLAFYEQARARRVIDPALFQLTDPADTWAMYRDRQVSLSVVSSIDYLA